MSELGSISFDRRFRGPPDSANGGYAAGCLAGFVDAPAVEVRLAAPPPLERPLSVVDVGGGMVELRDGASSLIAFAQPGRLDLDVPRPVGYETAVTARARMLATFDASVHVFPTCFGCGPERERGDALQHMVGRVPGRDDGVLACPLTTDPELPATDGAIDPAVVWAALDCPSGWAAFELGEGAHVLGTFTAELRRPIRVDERAVVMSWGLGGEGRKRYSAVAIVDESGSVAALAAAVWIRLAAG